VGTHLDQLVHCMHITLHSIRFKTIEEAVMSTSFPVSPVMGRRHHTLHHSSLNLSQANDSLLSIDRHPRHRHNMNRSSKTTTGGYTTRDETEVEPSVKSPAKKAAGNQEPIRARQLVQRICGWSQLIRLVHLWRKLRS
jgi:hypothetical protein